MKRKNINIQGKDIEVFSIGQNSNHIELDDLFNPQSQTLHEWIEQIRSYTCYEQLNILNYYFLNLDYTEENELIQKMKSIKLVFEQFIHKYYDEGTALFKSLDIPEKLIPKNDDLYLEISQFSQFEKDVESFWSLLNQ
jgi:hypothetical protein